MGVLFILTFITSIAGAFAYGPVLTDPHYVTGGGADTRVFVGAFLELLLIITNMGCAVVLFPLLKKQTKPSPSATLSLASSSARSSSWGSSASSRSSRCGSTQPARMRARWSWSASR